jgi:hypothetical protein
MDNQPNNLTETEQELAKLEFQLRESVAAEHFFETESGKLIEKLLSAEITAALAKIVGDEFKKDHTGYINELTWLQANKRLLRKLQIAASPIRRSKIQERLDQREEELGNESTTA